MLCNKIARMNVTALLYLSRTNKLSILTKWTLLSWVTSVRFWAEWHGLNTRRQVSTAVWHYTVVTVKDAIRLRLFLTQLKKDNSNPDPIISQLPLSLLCFQLSSCGSWMSRGYILTLLKVCTHIVYRQLDYCTFWKTDIN